MYQEIRQHVIVTVLILLMKTLQYPDIIVDQQMAYSSINAAQQSYPALGQCEVARDTYIFS